MFRERADSYIIGQSERDSNFIRQANQIVTRQHKRV